MSQLTQKLILQPQNARRPAAEKISPTAYYEMAPSVSFRYQAEYRLGAFLYQTLWLDEALTHAERLKTNAFAAARKQLIEELYGEFRKPLLKALMAVEMEDAKAARETLKEIMGEMFEERWD